MYITAQVIGILGMIANIISYQFKSKKNLLLCQFAGSALFAVNMFMLNAVMGGILNILGVVRALVYMKKDSIRIPVWILNTLFLCAYTASYVLLFTVLKADPTVKNFILELMPVIGMSIMTLALSGDNSKTVRLVGIANSSCWLTYNCFNFTIGGILCEAFSLVSIISAVIRIDIKRKKESSTI